MIKSIVLSSCPPSTSHIYKYRNCGKFIQGYMSKEGKDMKEGYKYEMMSQRKGLYLTDNFSMVIKFYFKDKRRRDLDNYNKLILDAGSGVIWEDDKLISDLHLYKFIDKDNPRVEIEILYD